MLFYWTLVLCPWDEWKPSREILGLARTILPALRDFQTHEDKASVWMTYFVGNVAVFTFSHCLMGFIVCLVFFE